MTKKRVYLFKPTVKCSVHAYIPADLKEKAIEHEISFSEILIEGLRQEIAKREQKG